MKENRKIGIIGGGQLAMMIAETAKKYNIDIECLDPNKNCSASKFSKIISGSFDDKELLNELFKNNQFVSYEFENINLDILNDINDKNNDKCIQGIFPLFLTNNRIREKFNLKNLNINTNRCSIIKKVSEIKYYLKLYNGPIFIKKSELGYDGKGQVLIKDLKDQRNIKIAKELILNFECVVEECIFFEYEISITGVFYGNDKFLFLPISKNFHQNSILYTSEVLIDKTLQKKAEKEFKKIANEINTKSIYTLEFFVLKNKELFLNEIAPRVHNSSHHGIENFNISQYDIFLSLFFNLNLPKLKILKNNILINVLGQHYENVKKELKKDSKVIFHDYYKKEFNNNRKMGHLIINKENKKLVYKYMDLCKN